MPDGSDFAHGHARPQYPQNRTHNTHISIPYVAHTGLARQYRRRPAQPHRFRRPRGGSGRPARDSVDVLRLRWRCQRGAGKRATQCWPREHARAHQHGARTGEAQRIVEHEGQGPRPQLAEIAERVEQLQVQRAVRRAAPPRHHAVEGRGLRRPPHLPRCTPRHGWLGAISPHLRFGVRRSSGGAHRGRL